MYFKPSTLRKLNTSNNKNALPKLLAFDRHLLAGFLKTESFSKLIKFVSRAFSEAKN